MDPIANMLVTIKNGLSAKKDKITVPYSRIKFEIAKIFKEKGLIRDSQKTDYNLIIKLKYNQDGTPKISNIKKISRPGRRIYVSCGKVPRVKSGLGFVILSTPKGVIDGSTAKKMGVGGEIICQVW